MKRVVLVLLIVCLLFITGCAKILMSGTVIKKTHIPASRNYRPLIMVIGKHTQIFPRWVSVAEKWVITVKDGEDVDEWDVSKEYYNSVDVGDYVSRRKENVE